MLVQQKGCEKFLLKIQSSEHPFYFQVNFPCASLCIIFFSITLQPINSEFCLDLTPCSFLKTSKNMTKNQGSVCIMSSSFSFGQVRLYNVLCADLSFAKIRKIKGVPSTALQFVTFL